MFWIIEAPLEFEEDVKSIVDELREVYHGIDENPYPMFIGFFLNKEETNNIINLISKFKD